MIGLYRSRRGFSLLEVMIATAILAASAMVLLSLISLGTRFGSKAETRIGGLVQAQSILDESILRMQAGESIESYTAVLPGTTPKSTKPKRTSLSSSLKISATVSRCRWRWTWSRPRWIPAITRNCYSPTSTMRLR